MAGDRDELLAIQRAYGIVRSFTFCLDEPDRHPAFTRGERPHARAREPRRPASSSRSSASTSTRRRSRRRDAASTSARAASSSIPAPSASSPTTRGSSRCSRLAAERRVPVLIHGGRGLPPIADSLARLARPPLPAGADHRPRGDRRPRRDGTELRRAARGLLRHVGVERARPARPLPARAARAGRLRVRLPVRAPAELAPARACARRGPPGSTTASCGRCSTTPAPGSPTASTRSPPTAPRGADGALAPGHVPPDPPVPDDGVGDALDATSAGHVRRASASRSTPATSAPTGTATRPTRSASCSSRPATSGSSPQGRRTTTRSGGAPSAAPSGSSTSRACSR